MYKEYINTNVEKNKFYGNDWIIDIPISEEEIEDLQAEMEALNRQGI